MYSFEEVERFDPEVAAAMDKETNRQRDNIELIASENLVTNGGRVLGIAAHGCHNRFTY